MDQNNKQTLVNTGNMLGRSSMASTIAQSGTATITENEDDLPKLVAPQAAPRQYRILYISVAIHVYGHLAALYGLYLAITTAMWKTLIFNFIVYVLAGIGATAGAHRLWTHRAYKAKTPLQILLIVMQSMNYQNTAFEWVKKHRMHHRYSDTDADPHNAARGFFFSHIGWLLVKRHPDVKRREHLVDMSDMYANPAVMFQKRYAVPLISTLCLGLPSLIPIYYFGESLNVAWNVNFLRYVFNLHAMLSVNSVAHMWGNRPYDKGIQPTQSLFVSYATLGEGFHNYHHAFPWDYRTAELGSNWNPTTIFINFFAWIGWAYDLKTVPKDVVRSRAIRTGDGSNMWGFK